MEEKEKLTQHTNQKFGYKEYEIKGVCACRSDYESDIESIIGRLGKYEDTNLSPAEIETLKAEIKGKDYLAYKLIKDKIKGCLDREKTLEKENAELKEQLKDEIKLPLVAMIQQQLDSNGNFDKSNKEQGKNGRYAVVYLDEKVWKIPMIDICSRQSYNTEACLNRLKELKEGK